MNAQHGDHAMAQAPAGPLIRFIRQLTGDAGRDLSDGQLLARFAADREEAAFAALVGRHGPLVWRICRHVLGNEADAEDAFQATFLVLAKSAGSICKSESVGSWLHGVARRIAVRLRQATARRREHERHLAGKPAEVGMGAALRELQAILDEEVQALPARYRLPFEMCCLEGRSRKEAARTLGWKEGTVSGRLARARLLLQQRLGRRGVTLSAALCVGAVRGGTAPAVPAALARAAVHAAGLVAAGKGGVSARVLALSEGVVNAMVLTKVKLAAAAVLMVALAGIGVGTLAGPTPAEALRPAKGARAAAPQKDEPKETVKPAALLKQAAEAAHGIENPTAKVWVLVDVARGQARQKETEAAAQTFRDAIEAARNVPGFEKNHRLMDVAQAQAQAGDVKGARETADAIEHDNSRENALGKIAAAQAEAGDLKGAEESIAAVTEEVWKGEAMKALALAQARAGKLKEADKTAAAISHDASRIFALTALVPAHLRAKDATGAATLLKEARKTFDGFKEDDEQTDTRSATAGALAMGLAEAGDVKEARKLADTIKKPLWKAGALLQVAKAQAQNGDVKGAVETADAIDDAYCKGDALAEVVKAQVGAGDLKAALKTQETIEHPSSAVQALLDIAKALALAGDRDAAVGSFDKALKTAQSAGDIPGRVGNVQNACLAQRVRAMAESGLTKEAAAWAAEQTEPLLKAQALVNVVEGMAARKGKGK
jgi:RNA polymerase sigma factor (sigma-70 family)